MIRLVVVVGGGELHSISFIYFILDTHSFANSFIISFVFLKLRIIKIIYIRYYE